VFCPLLNSPLGVEWRVGFDGMFRRLKNYFQQRKKDRYRVIMGCREKGLEQTQDDQN
jgi:hypothetical protein